MIFVGSANRCKVAAVRAVIRNYPALADAEVTSFDVESGVSDQPMTLEETQHGANNRALAAWISGTQSGCDRTNKSVTLSIGIESGIFMTGGRAYDVCVCAVTENGTTTHVGMSCAFEIPPTVMDHVQRGLNLAQASCEAGLSDNPKLGEAEGIIGILSQGRVTRQDYTAQAISCSLFFLNHPQLYSRTQVSAATEAGTETSHRAIIVSESSASAVAPTVTKLSTAVSPTSDRRPVRGDRVVVHYSASLQATGQIFDSSRKSGGKSKPLTFTVGEGTVIQGWEALFLDQIQLGERSTFAIPGALGYGSKGIGGIVPRNADLIFEIELLAIGRWPDQDCAPGFHQARATPPASKKQKPNARCSCGSDIKVKHCTCGSGM